MISAHVPNLELCRQLKSLGYPQETEFWWLFNPIIKHWSVTNCVRGPEMCSAPLVSELAEWVIKQNCGLPRWTTANCWEVYGLPDNECLAFDGSMPDAYATQCLEILKGKEKV